MRKKVLPLPGRTGIPTLSPSQFMKKQHLGALALAALSLLVQAGAAQAAPAYEVTILPADGYFSRAFGLSDNGLVTGWARPLSNDSVNAVTWNASSLSVIGSDLTQGRAVNNAGQVAGVAYAGLNLSTAHATVWQNGVAKALDKDTDKSEAYAINTAGQVAGWSGESFRCCQVATVWDTATGQQRKLSTIESEARAINNQGDAAGWSNVDGYMHATLWTGTQTVDLGKPSESSIVHGMNDLGQMVGLTWSQQSVTNQAVVWNGTTATKLASVSVGRDSAATDINNHGLIVGTSFAANNGAHAALWIGTDVIDLNSYLDPQMIADGWVLTSATGINEQDWIVGLAEKSTSDGTIYRGFLLSPVPEASSHVMALTGLLTMAGIMRSRKRRVDQA